MSSNKIDPLAKILNTEQLSGLSAGEGKTTKENPLGIDFEALDSMRGLPRPKTPPKPKSDEVQEEAEESVAQIEVESEVEPEIEQVEEEQDPEVTLRLALVQQALMRAKIKRDREAQAKEAAAQEQIQEEDANKSHVGERLASISSNEKKSAMDIFLDAMDEEAPKTKAKSKSMKPAAMEKTSLIGETLSLRITALIQNQLSSLTAFDVSSAMDSFDRSHLKEIWMIKKTAFLQSGNLESAVAALSVLDALDRLADGNLVAANVEMGASNYLIWVDLENNKLVAAFVNSGEYFG